jgi:hypothetical protein
LYLRYSFTLSKRLLIVPTFELSSQDQFYIPQNLKMKASVLSLVAVAAAASAYSNSSTTSTVYTTSVYTVTSCAPTVTDCPAKMGSVTTDIISLYTTVCPVTETETSSSVPTSTEAPWTTSTVYETVEYTITSCAPTVTNCPVGSKTTSVKTYTTSCPVETGSGSGPTKSPYSPPASSLPGGPVKPTTSAPTSPVTTAPVLATSYVTTCVPTVITSVYTVTAATVTKPYSTGSPTGGYPVGPKNSTVPFTGGASAQKAGGLLMAVGLAAALL